MHNLKARITTIEVLLKNKLFCLICEHAKVKVKKVINEII